MKKIRWGILGTSYISEVMANAIHESSTGELIAIGSRSHITAKNFATKFSIPKIYDNYQYLLNDNEIDAIYIGLPNHLHKEWMIRCAEAGKNILCEKPFVTRVEDAYEVAAVIEKTNVFCMEALMYRCHPFIKKIRELIHDKILGEIKLYNATYTAPIAHIANPTAGGSIRNLGCYPISLVRLLANAEPIEIRGSGRMNVNHYSDSQASVILKFADHAMAVVSTADDLAMKWHFEVYGTKGHLKAITNPWLPERDNNKLLIHLDEENRAEEITIQADKSLYSYQIDLANLKIMGTPSQEEGVSLADSIGNTVVLETWLNQVQPQ